MPAIADHSFSTNCTPTSQTIPQDIEKTIRRNTKPSIRERLQLWFSPQKAKNELCDPMFWHDVFLETVLCVFANCSIVWVGLTLNKAVYQPAIVSFGLYAGFLVMTLVEGWAPLCGCHVNVAATLSSFIYGRMSPIKCLAYFIVEIGGGVAGAILAKSLTPEKYYSTFFAIMPGEGMTDFQAVMVEAVLTFNMIIVLHVVLDPKMKPSMMGSLPVGFAIGTGILAAGTHTGGLQQPIIALIYAINANNFDHHWIYWVGPFLGSTVATVFYMVMEQVRDKYKKTKEPAIDSNHDCHEHHDLSEHHDMSDHHDMNDHHDIHEHHDMMPLSDKLH